MDGVRLLRGLPITLLVLGLPAVLGLYVGLFAFFIVYGLPAYIVSQVVDEIYLDYVDHMASRPTGPGAAAYFSVLASEVLLLAWWIGGGQTWTKRLIRASIAALIYILATGILLLTILIEGAAAGL